MGSEADFSAVFFHICREGRLTRMGWGLWCLKLPPTAVKHFKDILVSTDCNNLKTSNLCHRHFHVCHHTYDLYHCHHEYNTYLSVVGPSARLFLYAVQVNFLNERKNPTFSSPQVLFDVQSRTHFFVMPSWRPPLQTSCTSDV